MQISPVVTNKGCPIFVTDGKIKVLFAVFFMGSNHAANASNMGPLFFVRCILSVMETTA